MTTKSRMLTMLLSALLWIAMHHTAQAFYNPSTGRWLSRDPVGEGGGIGLTTSLDNDLMNNTDFLGQVKARKIMKTWTRDRLLNNNAWGWTNPRLDLTRMTPAKLKEISCGPCIVKKKPELTFYIEQEYVKSGKQSWKEDAVIDHVTYPNRSVFVGSDLASHAKAHEEMRFSIWEAGFKSYFEPKFEDAAAKLQAATCPELKQMIDALFKQVMAAFDISSEGMEILKRQKEWGENDPQVYTRPSYKMTGFGNVTVEYE